MIQIKKEYVISAEASNLFPKLNEPVKIKVKFKAPNNEKQGNFALYFSFGDGIEFVRGEQSYRRDIRKDEIVTMEANIKFKEKMVYFISFNLTTVPNKQRLVCFTFYVDGAFRESQEVYELRREIAHQKKIIKMAQSPKDIGLIDFSGQTFSDSVMGNHTIFTKTTTIEMIWQHYKKKIKLYIKNLRRNSIHFIPKLINCFLCGKKSKRDS